MWRHSYLQLHFCVLLWGLTAVLGKLITLAAIPLVFWRVLIVSLCLVGWRPLWRKLGAVSRRDLALAVANGAIITIHWLCFYGAVKAANASVAATCLALAPVFLALFDPWLQRQPFSRRNLLIGVLALPGVALVVGGIPQGMLAGFLLGALAALLAALFSSLNKGLAERMPALPLTMLQMLSGTLLLAVLIPVWPLFGAESTFRWPPLHDWGGLLLLALACTLLPFVLINVVLRQLSAFTVQLAVNLEPVYAIALAALLLHENAELRWPFYLGVALILGAVLGHVAWQRQSAKR